MLRLFVILQIIVTSYCCLSCSGGQNQSIEPGKIWNDTQGNPINAHGGGILLHEGIYYWFGEIKKDSTWRVPYITTWECYRTNAGGVSCYSSKNLTDWEYEGVALVPERSNPASDIHFSKVIERPKVIYNQETGKFVMWMHIDSEDYSYARAGVAVSDSPAGPYTYLHSIRPNNQMSRDMTLFKDDDGNAYHIYSSENNATLYISLLSDDFLSPSGTFIRTLENQSREAPAIFKQRGKYYLITSGCTGWAPNPASYAVADSVLGHWEVKGNPCVGKNAETTFDSQSTFVLQAGGSDNAFIFMADRWNKADLEDSRYVWLPINIENDELSISWIDQWDLRHFADE
ncbi:MAG: glycosyl hydrolase family 43 [Bacteroidia bacterium]|nr:MAG: glycosyl hydrolase family 43 [Bacteroidia bacterium]